MELSTSTVSGVVTDSIGDLGAVLGDFIPEILGILIALFALGMGIRYLKKYVTGKKF